MIRNEAIEKIKGTLKKANTYIEKNKANMLLGLSSNALESFKKNYDLIIITNIKTLSSPANERVFKRQLRLAMSAICQLGIYIEYDNYWSTFRTNIPEVTSRLLKKSQKLMRDSLPIADQKKLAEIARKLCSLIAFCDNDKHDSWITKYKIDDQIKHIEIRLLEGSASRSKPNSSDPERGATLSPEMYDCLESIEATLEKKELNIRDLFVIHKLPFYLACTIEGKKHEQESVVKKIKSCLSLITNTRNTQADENEISTDRANVTDAPLDTVKTEIISYAKKTLGLLSRASQCKGLTWENRLFLHTKINSCITIIEKIGETSNVWVNKYIDISTKSKADINRILRKTEIIKSREDYSKYARLTSIRNKYKSYFSQHLNNNEPCYRELMNFWSLSPKDKLIDNTHMERASALFHLCQTMSSKTNSIHTTISNIDIQDVSQVKSLIEHRIYNHYRPLNIEQRKAALEHIIIIYSHFDSYRSYLHIKPKANSNNGKIEPSIEEKYLFDKIEKQLDSMEIFTKILAKKEVHAAIFKKEINNNVALLELTTMWKRIINPSNVLTKEIESTIDSYIFFCCKLIEAKGNKATRRGKTITNSESSDLLIKVTLAWSKLPNTNLQKKFLPEVIDSCSLALELDQLSQKSQDNDPITDDLFRPKKRKKTNPTKTELLAIEISKALSATLDNMQKINASNQERNKRTTKETTYSLDGIFSELEDEFDFKNEQKKTTNDFIYQRNDSLEIIKQALSN